MDDNPLTPEEAALIVGVPVAQLYRWAWLRVGPRNTGTRIRPRYMPEDLTDWITEARAHVV